MSPAGTANIEAMIRAAVSAAAQNGLLEDCPGARNRAKEGSPAYVLINSSFLYREKKWIPPNQCDRRLLLTFRSPNDFDLAVADGVTIKTAAKLFGQKAPAKTLPFAQVVAEELASVGDLLHFALLGKVGSLRAAREEVKTARVNAIELLPGTGGVGQAEPGVFRVNGIQGVEEVLRGITAHLGSELTEGERESTGRAYLALVDGAVSDIGPPDGSIEGSVLGVVAAAMAGKATEYAGALDNYRREPGSAERLNEVLRLAYNFSSDALPLLGLFVSICDLKPILFWCTLDRQWTLHRSFTRLPWAALGRKGNLANYAAVVAGARSQAFHHIVPFDTAIEASLESADVRADRVRLFSLHGAKDGGVRLREQDIADILKDFSRGANRPVGMAFWEGNSKVLAAAASLAEGMASALQAVYAAAHPT